MYTCRNIFPDNLIRACLQQVGTEYTQSFYNETTVEWYTSLSNETVGINGSFVASVKNMDPIYNGSHWFHYFNVTRQKFKIVGNPNYQAYTNVLGLVCFSIFFGLILSRMGKRGAVMNAFFVSLNEVIMEMVMLIMWYSPVGICFLIIGKFLEIEDLLLTAKQLGLYMVTVIVGLLIHTCITLAGLFWIFTRKNPFSFFKGMLQAFVTAVGTASRLKLVFFFIVCDYERIILVL